MAQKFLVGLDNAGFTPFSRKKQCAKVFETASLGHLFEAAIVGIILADGPHGCRRREQHVGLMLFNDPPECACVWRPNWFPFEEDSRCPNQEWPI